MGSRGLGTRVCAKVCRTEEVVLCPAWHRVGGLTEGVGGEVRGSPGLAAGWGPWYQNQDEGWTVFCFPMSLGLGFRRFFVVGVVPTGNFSFV